MAVASAEREVSRLESTTTVVASADGPSWTRSAHQSVPWREWFSRGDRWAIWLHQVSQPIRGKKSDGTPSWRPGSTFP